MKKITCHDINNNQYEVEADKVTFRPSVYGIVIEDNKVLLSKQWDGYDLPGGGVELNETMEEALVREIFEETGIRAEVVAPIHAESSFFTPKHSPSRKDEYWNCPMLYFVAKKVGGELSSDNFDEDEKNYAEFPEWIDLDQLDKIKFVSSVDVRKVIEKVIK